VKHLPAVGITQFQREDIVRSGLVQMIVESYDQHDETFEEEVADALAHVAFMHPDRS
jgi:phosphate starvation-inducible protein PhoH